MLVSKLFLSNSRSSATLWVRDALLIVGLLPFYDHLDYCFVVFGNVKESFAFCGDMIDIDQFGITSVGVFLCSGCWCVSLIAHCRTIFPGYKVGSMKNVLVQQPKPRDRERDTVHS